MHIADIPQDPIANTFTCQDCGAFVYCYLPFNPVPACCLLCDFISKIEDPAERAAIRARLRADGRRHPINRS